MAENPAELLELATRWLEKIKKRKKARDESWGKDAEAAERAYAVDDKGTHGKVYDFNILHSNVETIVPAVFNSVPVPDIRERFRQNDDAATVAREVADVFERAVSVQIDDSVLTTEVEDVARDGLVAGRGVLRVRFEADADGDGVTNERVEYEAVAWRDYIEGPASRFSQIQWIAFRHNLTREETDRISDDDLMSLQMTEEEPEDDPDTSSDNITVWEVWCKATRRVKFVREHDSKMLVIKDDPLGLKGFFPICKPLQPITLTGKRAPVVPFKIYHKLADELDQVTRRINKITAGLKVRGLLITGAEDVSRLAQAEDNELVTASNLESLGTLGLDKAVMWWPIETAIAVLRELYASREQTKQTIYEITGISDIVRGASESRETATAQKIKTQWGSLRIRRMQTMIERLVREAFVITVELIARNFSHETLQRVAGMQVSEGAAQLIADPLLHYRIDVESDSTVKGDLSRQKTEMAEFLKGTAEFFAVMQPVVAASPQVAAPIVALYASFARQFNLGRQAETALDELVEMASQAAKQPQNEGNPEEDAKKAEIAGKMQAAMQELQVKSQEAQAKLALEQQKLQADSQSKEAGMAMDAQRLEMDSERFAAELEIKRQQLQADADAKRDEFALKVAELDLKGRDVDLRQADSMATKMTETEPAMAQAVTTLAERIEAMGAEMRAGLEEMGRAIAEGMNRPKRVVHDGAGRVVGVE